MKNKKATRESVKITFENETTGHKFYIKVHEDVFPNGQAECGHLIVDDKGEHPMLNIDVTKVGSLHILQASLLMEAVNSYYFGSLRAEDVTHQKLN